MVRRVEAYRQDPGSNELIVKRLIAQEREALNPKPLNP